MKMIAAIVAMDKNGAIGQGNKMPWHLPNDLRYFKEVTKDSVVLMGRKTFESIGKKLPNRINIVLTKNPENYNDLQEEGLYFIDDFEDALSLSKSFNKTIFITGGSEVYKKYIDVCDFIYVTHIHAELDPVDAFFPKEVLNEYKVISNIKAKKNEKNDYDHDFVIYKKS